MLERILSPRARKLYFTVILVMLGYVLFQRFTDSGLAARLDYFQAEYIFSGYYHPELTILILAVPIVALGFSIGFIHDYLTGQGIFAGRESGADFSKPASNWKIEYQATSRVEMIEEVRSKFRSEIYQLKMLGFEEIGFYREIVPWFGVRIGLTGILGAAAMLANEVTRMGPHLTVNGFFILMASKKESSYASISKLGIKFHTVFQDGTCLITASYKGIEFQDEAYKFHRSGFSGPLSSAFAGHRQKVDQFEAGGKRISGNISMSEYFSIIIREDEYMLRHLSKLARSAKAGSSHTPGLLSAVISTLVSMGILLGVVFAFTFAGNVISRIYPSCWFVRNLENMTLLPNFLGVPGFLGTSWLLARTQHNLFTVNGMGTKLYGKEPIHNSERFISTKWLALPGVPLLPVRSYSVGIERIPAVNQESYDLQPLTEINWSQVKETIRSSWLGYAILGSLFVAFISWSTWKCR